jgi:hypothetical protein
MPPLRGHSTVRAGDALIGYGGITAGDALNGDVYTLDLLQGTWQRLLCGGMAPPPRAFHSAVMVDTRMIVFGGLLGVSMKDVHFNTHNVFAHADLFPLRVPGSARLRPDAAAMWPRTRQQTEPSGLHVLSFRGSDGSASWTTMPAIGVAPVHRAHHNACVHGAHMFVHGGYCVYGSGNVASRSGYVDVDEDAVACRAVYALNTESFVWRVVATAQSIERPIPWGGASCLLPLGLGHWISFGGVDTSQPAETASTVEIILGNVRRHDDRLTVREPGPADPPARFHASCVAFGSRAILYGGSAAVGTLLLSDVWCLAHGDWQPVECGGEMPAPRCAHTATIVGDDMVVVGGLVYGADAACLDATSDVYALHLPTMQWRRVPHRSDPLVRRAVMLSVPSSAGASAVSEGSRHIGNAPHAAWATLESELGASTAGFDAMGASAVDRLLTTQVIPLRAALDATVDHALTLARRQAQLATALTSNLHPDARARAEADDYRLEGYGPTGGRGAPGAAEGHPIAAVAAAARGALNLELVKRLQRIEDAHAGAGGSEAQLHALLGNWRRDMAGVERAGREWRRAVALRDPTSTLDEAAIGGTGMADPDADPAVAALVYAGDGTEERTARIRRRMGPKFYISPSLQRLGLERSLRQSILAEEEERRFLGDGPGGPPRPKRPAAGTLDHDSPEAQLRQLRMTKHLAHRA